MKEIIERVRNADTIYLPNSGREQPGFKDWLENTVNIEVPDFKNRELVKISEDKTFAIVRAESAMQFVEEDENSTGSVGTDKFKEYQFGKTGWNTKLRAYPIGKTTCKLALMCLNTDFESFKSKLENKDPLTIGTSFPLISDNYANNNGFNFDIKYFKGCIEALPNISKVDGVIDIIGTGDSMRDNKLIVIKTIKDIYPSVILKSDLDLPDNPTAPPIINISGLLSAIKVIKGRADRVIDQGESPETYSEKLLVSTNEMIKKFGSEQAELIKAYLTESDKELLNESADVLYSTMLLLASRSLNLTDVLNILADRNVPKR